MRYSLSKFYIRLAIQQNRQCVSNSKIDSSFTIEQDTSFKKNHCQELTLKETSILFYFNSARLEKYSFQMQK